MIILEEGSGAKKLRFEFSSQWKKAFKYDGCQFYTELIVKCQHIQAVDFIATKEDSLLWIEVKNFRGFAAENRPRLLSEEPQTVIDCRNTCNSVKQEVKISRQKPYLADVVAKKVRDTFFGLAVALYKGEPTLKPYIDDLGRNIQINIVLFLHQDEELDNPQKFKDLAPKLKTRIEQQLRCLNVNVQVENSLTLPESAGWKVL
ncbi:hypothetical protein PN36_20320 [Candidatus Thiomargarita nelsonii]|uniref:Uncharacterized protein n=1 Tax=Candidatus Thiomargarita nelsonii TaxID=1003181 RepID=A0A4E0R241_9GAMM|nr:hypothetical protein PN36_20320 [Candidatus Thiomargarita nelsonii]